MKRLFVTLVSLVFVTGGFSLASNYTMEQQNAYNYAYGKGITTISSIEKANINGSLMRIAMAKMISNFAINELGLQPDTSRNCSFSDVSSSLDAQYNYGVTQACQLGLMGIGNDGKKSNNFNPYETVTRAQFATAFSRAFSSANGDTVREGQPYYKWHLEYLKGKGIIKDINSPTPYSIEKRGNVMIMMQRSSDVAKDNKETSTNKNDVNYDGILGVEILDTGISNELKIKITNNTKITVELKGLHLSSVKSDKSIGVYQGDNTMQPEYLAKNSDNTIDVNFWYPAILNKGDSTLVSIIAEAEGSYAIVDEILFSVDNTEYSFSKYTSSKTKRNGLFVKNDGNIDGKKNGTEKKYYSNGELREVLNYKDGKLNGEYIEYYYNGNLSKKGQYKNNKKTGEWVEYFEDGSMASKGSYKDGELDGYWIRYCEKGDTKCTSLDGNYKNGEKIWGVEEYGTFNTYAYWGNGTIQSASFIDNNGVLNGDYVSFYENGQVKERGQYKNNKKTGEWVEYYSNAEVKSEKIYKNGIDLDSYLKVEKESTPYKNSYNIKITNLSSGKIRITGILLGDFKRDYYANVYLGDNTMDSIMCDDYDEAEVKFPYPVDISSKDSTTMSIKVNEDGESIRFEKVLFEMEEDNYGEEYSVSKAIDL